MFPLCEVSGRCRSTVGPGRNSYESGFTVCPAKRNTNVTPLLAVKQKDQSTRAMLDVQSGPHDRNVAVKVSKTARRKREVAE